MLNDALKSIKTKDTNFNQIDTIYQSKIDKLNGELYILSVYDFTNQVNELIDGYRKNGLNLSNFYLQLKISTDGSSEDFHYFNCEFKVKSPSKSFPKDEYTNASLLAKEMSKSLFVETQQSRGKILKVVSNGFASKLLKNSGTYNYFLNEETLVEDLKALLLNDRLKSMLDKELLSISLAESEINKSKKFKL